ncbi:molybdenum cofactor biosynthesis protein B [Natronoarchaeum philippinense]|uniref:Molybdenum cofactor biosynthesis protein B n=1 Tax=Natronoarchaeum philippinense TaxID=558529 RepID=A0A285P5W1_NATPI|nr:molybdopterin-binding protein [Natronoarchaeum philippinense]SNZ17149.1 molybdenum cofactor biosynthesis protein B [Natronoarchaeum philippinense]
MVDFQQRDTRRDLRSDDDDESASNDADDAASSSGDEDVESPESEEGERGDADSPETRDADVPAAPDPDDLGAAVLTISSERSLSDDPPGDAAVEELEAVGTEIVTRELVEAKYDNVQAAIDRLADRSDVHVVVTVGATGITPDDVAIEAAEPLFDKELDGFGELLRLLAYDEVATRVVATRATAGIVTTVPVFCLPGVESIARLGVDRIVAEEAAHLVELAHDGDPDKHPR